MTEAELFAYIRTHQETAQELYYALAGTEADGQETIEVRETAGAYFLAKKNGAMFAFAKQEF